MSASKPSTMPKRFAAARLEDQEDIENMAREPIRMGTPPFSSPDPATDGVRMLPLEGGHGSVGTTLVGDENSADSGDDKGMKAADWKKEVEEAANQETLDEIATRYDESGADYATVKSAIEKRQEELDAAGDDGNDN